MISLLLLFTTFALGGDRFEQKLAKRELELRMFPQGRTLSQALAELSADYEKRYHEPLRIFIAADLAAKQSPPPSPPPVPAGPLPATDPSFPADAHIGMSPLRAPAIELLRFCANLADVSFTIEGDRVLFHTKPK